MRILLLLSFPMLLLSACAGQDGQGYPSLSKRAIENGLPAGDAVLPIEADPDSGAEQQLRQTIADLMVKLSNGNVMFNLLYDEVAGRIRVAKSAAISSESWVAAQMDLSRLEQASYQSSYALAGLDTLYAGRLKAISEGKVSGSVSEMKEAVAQAQDIVAGQQAKIAALRAGLQQP